MCLQILESVRLGSNYPVWFQDSDLKLNNFSLLLSLSKGQSWSGGNGKNKKGAKRRGKG